MKVLVTGGTGFAGKHLVNELVNSGYEVCATSMHSGHLPNASIIQVDLSSPAAVKEIDFKSFDVIFHLAGLAAVGPSFNNPINYLRTNSEIQVNLLEACLGQGVTPKLLIVSSANIYRTDELPLKETSEVIPTSPYAVSKISQEYLGQYYGTRGFEIVIARAFNHMGPGQMEGFIVADFAKQIAAAEITRSKVIRTGNLEAKRDYTDVRDIARAYRLLIEKARPGEIYNVCSGKAISGEQILAGLLKHTHIKPKAETDPKLFRPVDRLEVYGSNNKIFQDTEWKPEIPLDRTLKETLDYWRNKNLS